MVNGEYMRDIPLYSDPIYVLRNLTNILWKLEIMTYIEHRNDYYHVSHYQTLKRNIDKRNALKELKSYEQEIKHTKATTRS